MASQVTKSTTHIRSAVAKRPIVTSGPATIFRHKTTAVNPSEPPTPSERPTFTLNKPRYSTQNLTELPRFIEPPYKPALIPPTLTFSFEQAKSHLIEADTRFEQLFASVQCQPFEQLEPVDPFQSLVTAVLQHTSWIGAKYIQHRFLRLFDRSLPEKLSLTHEPEIKYIFPSPDRVASVNNEITGSAGIGERKAGYVLDIAKRFADGRLSAKNLVDASDKEVEEMLTAARGIGKEKADLFAMMTLRRPDILLVGSLRTQQALLHWVLSSHEPENYPLYIDPKKLPKTIKDKIEIPGSRGTEPAEGTSVLLASAGAPTPTSTAKSKKSKSKQPDGILLVPTSPVQLPEGMILDTLKARANGEMAKGGRYLLPSEMEALTAGWKPYRSLGMFYMWALVGGAK
ncbi:DNA-3-methyladenine glycosylase II [Rhizoctonia solani]|uniref:DNA-3-methyladenine glycosylase II n=1 Tax=Rhizoctonia solani TaxID=456999 RepID=A0A0K6FKE0_9AGAM|nr:DNA-3-methyladenine glycosylase II [Rhizoctonia solani]